MILNFIFIFQIFSLFGIFVKAFYDYQCVDCASKRKNDEDCDDGYSWLKRKCKIYESGFSCDQYKFDAENDYDDDEEEDEDYDEEDEEDKKKKRIRKRNKRKTDWGRPKPTYNLDKCIPKYFNMSKIPEDAEFCCIWSRQQGCQMIVKPGTSYSCGVCTYGEDTNYEYHIDTCPCNARGRNGSPIQYSNNVIGIAAIAFLIFYSLRTKFL